MITRRIFRNSIMSNFLKINMKGFSSYYSNEMNEVYRYNNHLPRNNELHSTTVLSVRKNDKVVMIADGQISLGPTVFKNTAKKLRRINPDIVCGFAGSAADCLALVELLEKEFLRFPGQTMRACLSLAMMWRTNKMHSRLEASLIISDPDITI